jgi:F-type H+-transporting ATPase subunit gamma
MPSLIDLRRRIRAVKNTQQITKAMKMVAASKLRRAQERITSARPYAQQMRHVLVSVARRVDPSVHPLLMVREARPDARTLLVVISGDKGLCGSFNTNIIKATGALLVDKPKAYVLGLVGRKVRDFYSRRGFEILFGKSGVFQKLRYEDAQQIAETATEAFLSGQVDRVLLIYNEFRSVISQRVVIDQLLPIPRVEDDETDRGPATDEGAEWAGTDYLYEPSPQDIFDRLLPRHIEFQVYRALLESNAAFFAAQMTAMDTATKNSAEVIANLTLYMNKVRQAAITREIIEVVSGAQAL